MQVLAAEVVLAALQHRDPHLAPERGRGGRDVVREQLLLERLRRRRDDDALPGLERRDQVREALPHAGPGLREQVPPGRERMLDRGRERSLLGPRLVAGQGRFEAAARGEEAVHRRDMLRRGPVAVEHLFLRRQEAALGGVEAPGALAREVRAADPAVERRSARPGRPRRAARARPRA